MSAILGRIEFSGQPVDEELFLSALAGLSHYGPDGSGVRVDGPVGLGHQFKRLARRQSDEAQPLNEGSISIVADAVLDNRDDLCRLLKLEPSAGAVLTDSALILRAFLKWGRACTEHLLGDYSFAIYDRDRRELFLVRDHIGARPLYWARHGACVVFGTDMRGLVTFRDLDWVISDRAVANFLVRPDVPKPDSFYVNTAAVEPGHHLIITETDVVSHRWWDPRNASDVRYARQEDYVAHFRELTERSIAARVDTDLAVGAHISGGLDSTTIGVLAGQIMAGQGAKLRAAYAWAPQVSDAYPDMGRRDERRVIAATSDRLGVPMRYGTATGDDVVSFLGGPIELDGKANLLAELPLLNIASTDGIGVMLSGWGGDEAYSAHGIGYVSYLLKCGRIDKAISITRSLLRGRRNPVAIAKGLWENGIIPMLPDGLYNRATFTENIYVHQCFANPSLDFQGASVTGPRDDIRLVGDPIAFMNQLLLLGHLGERMDTWASWGAGADLVYRYPLTDRRLVEYTVGLPYELLFADGKSRFMARAAVADVLPEPTLKHDSANELLRSNIRLEAWRIMAKDLGAGRFDAGCDWLDMSAFRSKISTNPDTMTAESMGLFAEISSAARMWHLFQRSLS